ncbi:Uncharacterised protein [BD1-7 clade bacterium]|uniref:Uncharacterized protein n=1 Tax=BD1-7 clade bacterium TaxID=2029982 RepID=A0A5S9MQX3_9GAMM|nr:Uncharacterised protein [BD1-7 clade bacterium]
MSNAHITNLLAGWENQLADKCIEHLTEVPIAKGDSVKIDALAETYHLSRQQIIAHLLHSALLQVEESIPYVEGNKIIRVEEGDPLYEDVGKMPNYLAIKRRLDSH